MRKLVKMKNICEAKWQNLDAGKADYGSTPPGESFKHNSSLVRETVQNSIDAHNPNCKEPVLIDFEYLTLEGPDSLPDVNHYKERVFERISQHNRIENNRWLDEIDSFIKIDRSVWRILKIADHNTVGLDYEDLKGRSETGTWHKLVRAQNSSSKTKQEGGSFGLGSGAHSVCSLLYMVFYGSRSLRSKEYRFQGVAHLGSILNPNDPTRFCDSRVFYGIGNDGWEPSSNPPEGFPVRGNNDFGTDVFIVEPRFTSDFIDKNGSITEDLKKLIWYFIFNFAPSIKAGKVKARFIQNGKELYTIANASDASSFLETLVSLPEDAYERIFSESNVEGEVASARFLLLYLKDQLQRVDIKLDNKNVAELFLLLDKNAEKIVYASRSIGMRVARPWGPYKGLGQVSWLISIFDSGYNGYLRQLESPDHLSWTNNNSATSQEALKASARLRKEVRNIIESEYKKSINGDVIPVTDLGALMSNTAGDEIIETDIKIRPVEFKCHNTSSSTNTPQGNTKKSTEGKGHFNEPKPHRLHSKKKSAKRYGEMGGENKVFLPVHINDRILAIDPSSGIYVIKFTPDDDWNYLKINLFFNPDGGILDNEAENLSLCPEIIIDKSGCTKAEVIDKNIVLSDLKINSPVKLTVRIKEKLMSSLRVTYYVK